MWSPLVYIGLYPLVKWTLCYFSFLFFSIPTWKGEERRRRNKKSDMGATWKVQSVDEPSGCYCCFASRAQHEFPIYRDSLIWCVCEAYLSEFWWSSKIGAAMPRDSLACAFSASCTSLFYWRIIFKKGRTAADRWTAGGTSCSNRLTHSSVSLNVSHKTTKCT